MKAYTLLYIIAVMAVMMCTSLDVCAQIHNPLMNRQMNHPMEVHDVASPPSFVQPVSVEAEGGYLEADFPVDIPQFAWTPPVANNTPTARFVYDFRMTRVIPGQEIYDAAERGAVAFQQLGLLTPSCQIPQNVVVSLMANGTERFVVRVTARPAPGGPRVMMTNGGRSQIMVLNKTKDEVKSERIKE